MKLLMNVWFRFLLICVVGPWPAAAAEEPLLWPEAPAQLEMTSVEELTQDPAAPKLGNGSVADPSDWPASFIATIRMGNQDFYCTSTLIGSRTLLLAAHCVADGGR